ncbi:MAG: hypothetical protein QM757_01500 [Paludibaculum sp.]
MRITLILTLAAACGVFIWLVGLRLLSGMLDRLSTNRTGILSVNQLKLDNGVLELAGTRLDLIRPGSLPSGFRVALSGHGRVLCTYGSQEFPCGPGRQASMDGLPDLEFQPDPGDSVTFATEQSRLSWPTPLEMNFMTGSSPSWRRRLYHRLTWTKRSGARLEILWRYLQGYFPNDGWTAATVESGSAGYYRVKIVEAEDLRAAANQYLLRAKGWKPGEYRLEEHGPAADGNAEVIAAIHRGDEVGAHPGAGRSVVLFLDYRTRQVLRERTFQ